MSGQHELKNGKWYQRTTTEIDNANVVVPTSIEKHYSETIQTHNAVSVGASSWSNSPWFSCDGFDKIVTTLLNDASTTNRMIVQFSFDGSTAVGEIEVFPTDSKSKRTAEAPVGATYFKLNMYNGDSVAHTMSAWAYLKT